MRGSYHPQLGDSLSHPEYHQAGHSTHKNRTLHVILCAAHLDLGKGSPFHSLRLLPCCIELGLGFGGPGL